MKKTDAEILTDLTAVFREVLDDAGLVLTLETRQEEVDEWDSLAHIQLVLAVGRKFGLKFATQEVVDWTSVRAIVDCVSAKLS